MADENEFHTLTKSVTLPVTPARSKFAVFVPSDDSLTKVYNSKAEALQIFQSHKGARFASVYGEADAETFFSTEKQTIASPSRMLPGVAEESCPFSTPTLFGCVFSAVNRGDLSQLQNLVNQNPLYLITKVDSPAILHQGARYNALHICANKNLVHIARYIIETLRSGILFSKLYPNDSEESRRSRVNRVIDMYINSPDKYRSETPLHFASKMGNVDMVWLLSSQPECVLDCKNADGQTPLDQICERHPDAKQEMKSSIERALSGQFFIVILRSFSNPLEPTVRLPFRATSDNFDPSTFLNADERPFYRVTAYIGPVSKEVAHDIHELLTKPSRRRRKFLGDSIANIPDSPIRTPGKCLFPPVSPAGTPRSTNRFDPCVADPKYGLEDWAKQVCVSLEASFSECFQFSEGQALDLTRREGFLKMEDFLKSKHISLCCGCDICRKPDIVVADESSTSLKETKVRSSQCSSALGSLDGSNSMKDDTSWGRYWPIRWIGVVMNSFTGMLFRRSLPSPVSSLESPSSRSSLSFPTCTSTPNPRSSLLSPSSENTLSDSFIQKFAAMKLSFGDNSIQSNCPSVKVDDSNLTTPNNESRESISQKFAKVPVVFFGRDLSKPSEEDFRIFKLMDQGFVSEIDFPFVYAWFRKIEYIKQHTLAPRF